MQINAHYKEADINKRLSGHLLEITRYLVDKTTSFKKS